MKLNLLGLTLVALLITTANVPALAQSTTDTSNNPTEQEKIKKLMVLTGKDDLTQRMGLEQIIASMKSRHPQMPQQFWDNLRAEFNMNELSSKIIPIYSKYLTSEDIEGLIQFYETPLGRKMIAVYPEIMRESVKVGQQYGAEAGERAEQKLQEQGYIRR